MNPIFGQRDNGSHISDHNDRFEYLRDQGWKTLEIFHLFAAEEKRDKWNRATAKLRKLAEKTHGITVKGNPVFPRYMKRLEEARTAQDLEALRDDLLTILQVTKED